VTDPLYISELKRELKEKELESINNKINMRKLETE
jgi:hypothetical protein